MLELLAGCPDPQTSSGLHVSVFVNLCAALALTSELLSDMLELYFEKNWALPEQIVMVADEEAAIVSFSEPKGIASFNMTCLRANKNCSVWIKLREHLSVSPAGSPLFDCLIRQLDSEVGLVSAGSTSGYCVFPVFPAFSGTLSFNLFEIVERKQNQTTNKSTNSGVHIARGCLKVRTTNPLQNSLI